MADPQISAAVIGAGAAIGGGIVTWVLGQVSSYLEHRRKEESDRTKQQDREFAVLHGAFAVTNFLNARLNEFDSTRNVYSLTRLRVAEAYVRSLIERSPGDSERLMVSMVALGLRLEALMFAVGEIIDASESGDEYSLTSLEQAMLELGQAIETVEVIVTGELPFMTEEELAEFPELESSQSSGADEEK